MVIFTEEAAPHTEILLPFWMLQIQPFFVHYIGNPSVSNPPPTSRGLDYRVCLWGNWHFNSSNSHLTPL